MKKLLILEPNLKFEEIEIEGNEVTYEMLSSRLGFIEHLAGYNDTLDKHHISIWCDEEHKLKDGWELNSNIAVVDKFGRLVELLAGRLIFTIDGQFGETFGLDDEHIKIIKEQLSSEGIINFGMVNKKVKILKYTK